MRDSEHRDAAFEADKHDVEREVVNGQPPNIGIAGSRNDTARERELLEVLKRLPNFRREPFGHLFIALAVPLDRLAELALCTPAQANARQRDSTSR